MVMRGEAAAYGDVTGEYLALRRQAAFLTVWHDVVWVRGPDAVSFLDGLLSQSLAPMTPGGVAPSLLLGPQGKLRAPHTVLRGESEVGLITDAGVGDVAAGDLGRFKIRVDVTIEQESRPVITLIGPHSAAVLRKAAGVDAGPGWQRHHEAVVAAVPFSHIDLARFVVLGVDADRLVGAGAVRAGWAAGDAVRIEAGEPVMGVDIDEGTIPQEAGLVAGAVDFTKGCYLGQELVARIDSRGHVNRHLRGVVMTSNLIPPPGAEIVTDERIVGVITSVAESLEVRAPVALALVRREVEPGAPVAVRWEGGEVGAVVEAVPLAAAGFSSR